MKEKKLLMVTSTAVRRINGFCIALVFMIMLSVNATADDAGQLLAKAESAYENGDKDVAKELYKQAADLGSAEAHFAVVYKYGGTLEERIYHYSEAAKKGHVKALGYALNELFFRAENLRIADPQKALGLYREAMRNNPSMKMNPLKIDIGSIEKCTEPGNFDGAVFLRRYNLEVEHAAAENNPYYVWELAEAAANSERFGKPDAELVLQLICHGGFVPLEVDVAVDNAYNRWENGKAPHFDICENVTSKYGRGYCSGRGQKRTETKRAELSYPKVEDKIWTVKGVEILPSCLETEWSSGDNYEEYQEQFPSAEDFHEHPGRYWGYVVPLEPLMAGWKKPVSLPRKISECNVLEDRQKLDVDANHIRIITPEGNPSDRNSYRLLAEWGSKECSKVVPAFADSCSSLVFVERDEYVYDGKSYNSYAYISHGGEDYIVPVTNGMPLENLLEMLNDR